MLIALAAGRDVRAVAKQTLGELHVDINSLDKLCISAPEERI